jgi:hypothetical protein
MADERLRSKSELKRFVSSNLKRKGWTDDMVAILIDVLWRDKFTMRTSGFYYPGGTDAIMAFNNATRIFSILPMDPLVADFIPRYGFYSWSSKAVYHRKYETETIQLPNEEGLYAIYFAADETIRTQTLHYIKNPSEAETKDLYLKKVLISFVYWDYENQTTLYFGNDRHGSEWNPQMHWMLHRTLKGQVDNGLTVTDMLINEDGSLDSHAQFTVNAGTMWHDDFILNFASAGGIETIPILYFLGVGLNYPRFVETAGFGCYKGIDRICFNANAEVITEVNNDYHVMYHLFAVNEHVDANRKIITVMGQQQYETMAECYTNVTPELDTVYKYMPQQGTCYLGTIIFQVNNNYGNSVKARIVAFFEKDASHPPVSIAMDSVDFLEITESQVLSWKGEKPITIAQIAHGFTVGDAVRHNETIFVKAQANNDVNAQTCGIVTKVIDADVFQYKSDGFLIDAAFEAGKEYCLSPTVAGLVMEIPVPEVWTVGQVRQSLGFGTPQGLKIEIDVGDEIGEAIVSSNLVTSLLIAGGNLTLTQSEGDDVFTPFPYYTITQLQTAGQSSIHFENITNTPTTIAGYGITDAYTKTELNTSGAGGAVHWNNVTNKPSFSSFNSWTISANIVSVRDIENGEHVEFLHGDGLTLEFGGFATLRYSHAITSYQADSVNSGNTVIQSITLDDFGHITTLATKTVDAGITDHGLLSGLADNDHPQYALVHGDYANYFQVADLRIGAVTGWSLVDNGTVLELRYNGVKKFEFKTNGEAYGTDFIAY